jgi:hypothetical protein
MQANFVGPKLQSWELPKAEIANNSGNWNRPKIMFSVLFCVFSQTLFQVAGF